MTWLPISQTVPQYVDLNGLPATGYVLKFYSAGTSTNINLATDNTGGTQLTDVALNSRGFPETSGTVFIPHVEETYKIAFYATQAAADSDTGAIWTIDNISPALPLDLSQGITVDGESTFNDAVNLSKGSDVASASSCNIWVTDGNQVDITGTTSIDDFGTSPNAGATRRCRNDSALTLNHSANLYLPGQANIALPAGSFFTVQAITTTQFNIIDIDRSNGAGKVVQVVNTQDGEVATTTNNMDMDNSIPQNTEGAEFMTLAITPTMAGNKLRIDVVCHCSESGTPQGRSVALFQDSTAGALAAMGGANSTAGDGTGICFTHWMTAGTVASTTFKVRAGPNGTGTLTFNGIASGRIYGGVMASSITITEIQV